MTACPAQRVSFLGVGTWTNLGRGAGAQAEALCACPAECRPAALGSRAGHPYHLLAEAPQDLFTALQRVVADALEGAGLDAGRRARCGVFIGSSSSTVAEAETAFQARLHDPGASALDDAGGHGRLTERLAAASGLRGPRFYFGTACSSSANALLYAARMVARGELEHAVVVGVERYNRISLHGFESLLLLTSEDGRPFDRRREGLVLGEGVGALVIGRSESGTSAWRFLGGATNVDTGTPTNSSPESIHHAMRAALNAAGVAPDGITAIKAHGTGTPGNDQAESAGLRALYPESLPPVSSLKGALGHTMGACGAVEIAVTMACVDRGFWPASIGCHEPDPELGITPVRAPRPARGGRFLMNFFGFGGNNTACVIERDSHG